MALLQQKGPDRPDSSNHRALRRETKEHITDLLTNYSHQFVAAVNARNFEHPIWSRTSPEIYASSFDRYNPTSTLSDSIRTFQAIAASDPTYHIEVQKIDVIFEEEGEAVHAYADQRITGRPAGVAMDCIAVFTYVRRTSDWELVAFNAMRFSGPSI